MGEPSRGNALLPAAERIGGQEATGGREINRDPGSSGERNRASPNRRACKRAGVSAPVLLGGATEGRIPRPLLQTSHLGERPGKAGGTG